MRSRKEGLWRKAVEFWVLPPLKPPLSQWENDTGCKSRERWFVPDAVRFQCNANFRKSNSGQRESYELGVVVVVVVVVDWRIVEG